jgi:hypothetical protein
MSDHWHYNPGVLTTDAFVSVEARFDFSGLMASSLDAIEWNALDSKDRDELVSLLETVIAELAIVEEEGSSLPVKTKEYGEKRGRFNTFKKRIEAAISACDERIENKQYEIETLMVAGNETSAGSALDYGAKVKVCILGNSGSGVCLARTCNIWLEFFLCA